MAMISIGDLKLEFLNFLRNADILSTSERNVTTTNDTGTFSADSFYDISKGDVKNIRDITVGGSPLAYGTDYTFDLDYSPTACRITFTSPQTGAYDIEYDYGTDRIFPDYPKPNVKIGQFPRVGFDIISGSSSILGLGAETTQSTYTVSVVCYAENKLKVEDMVSKVRAAMKANQKNWFNCVFLSITALGPLIPSPFGEQKIVQRNQDAELQYIYES